MSKLARILELVRILRAKGFMSKQQILDRFEIAEPTFKRDLAFLRDEYGAQVQYDPQDNVYRLVSAGSVPTGGVPNGDLAEIPGLWFNEEELHSLLTMYELLKGHGGQGVVTDSGRRWQLSFPYSDLRELLMDVLKHGDQVEVLAPVALQEAIHTVCMAILSKRSKSHLISV
jgi:predicted DNA-binding transcriptional regulator YafY